MTRSYLKFPDAEAPIVGRTTYTLLPDGSAMVYVGKGGNDTQFWVKKRSELHATPIGATAGASNVFASPDGRWLGFIAGGKLKKVAVTGGEATTLAEAPCGSVASTGAARVSADSRRSLPIKGVRTI